MTAERAPRILHAGLHKTGSTFLQRKVFPEMKGLTYIHDYSFGRVPQILKNHQTPILFSSEAGCGYPYPETHEFCVGTLLANVRLLSISKVLLFTREFHR